MVNFMNEDRTPNSVDVLLESLCAHGSRLVDSHRFKVKSLPWFVLVRDGPRFCHATLGMVSRRRVMVYVDSMYSMMISERKSKRQHISEDACV